MTPNVQPDGRVGWAPFQFVDISVISSTAFSPDDHNRANGSNRSLRICSIEFDDFSHQSTSEALEGTQTNHEENSECPRLDNLQSSSKVRTESFVHASNPARIAE
jgi:hypothetical protein